jgi:Acyl-CoA thioesterase C-terminal domain/Acyl-CoA thioesterase N-terminal domain
MPATALFHRDGDEFVPTELTRGGWTDDTQHGAPPVALLARAIEAVPTLVEMQTTRFTVDLMRPVPLQPLRVTARVSREGKRIQLVDAKLLSGEVELGRATALRIRIGSLDLSPPWTDTMSCPPDELETLDWRGHFGERDMARFHYDAVELRTVDQTFLTPGAGESWVRLRVPVVEGEEMTPFLRIATVADIGNGNGQILDPMVHSFVNPDVSLHLHRLPVGEWIGMKSVSYPQAYGIGMADTAIFDRQGSLGRVIQSQILDLRVR